MSPVSPRRHVAGIGWAGTVQDVSALIPRAPSGPAGPVGSRGRFGGRALAWLTPVLCAALVVPAAATEPGGGSDPAGGHDTSRSTHAHLDDTADGLTGEQQDTLDRITSAAGQAASAAGSVQSALQDASLAAAAAAAAQTEATQAQSAAAAESLRAELAQLDVVRMQQVVDSWVRQMAVDESGTFNHLWSILVDPSADPSAELAVLQSGERVAGEVANAVVDLRTAREAVEEQTLLAARAAEKAARSAGKARRSARVAARVLESARGRYLNASQGLMSLVDASAVAELTGAAPVGQSGAGMVDKVEDVLASVPVPGDTTGGAVGCLNPLPGVAYSNGMLTPEVLCGVGEAPGHKLRTDAAAKFDALSRAYARTFGTGLCITDSYRTLSAQVDLKRRKPYLAAKPGTSNHGWGVAVDACGGVESFGTDEHQWMMANAVLFGWVLPAWAQENGSKPEPWHWEFSPELAEQMAQVTAALRQAENVEKPGLGKRTGGPGTVRLR